MENSNAETSSIHDAEAEPIIVFTNAYKRYGSNCIVLKGLNMSVNKGSIYGLLGPSGCGKTTLLSCVVGRQRLDFGSVYVGLDSRLQLGYMTQEISLYENLTMFEIFMYFGLLLKKDKNYISTRGKEILEFLELPPIGRTVSSLSFLTEGNTPSVMFIFLFFYEKTPHQVVVDYESVSGIKIQKHGGQQRRASMAVTLLHDPLLMILDEPTAGLDPLLCHKIWDYFLKLSNEEKKTIVITTHYIEEARNANTIGLMRDGVILAETCPKALMASLNCTNLEDAFLILSEKQEKRKNDPVDYPSCDGKKPDLAFETKETFQLYRFLAQLYKNYCWIVRNVGMMLFMMVLPAVLFWLVMHMLGGSLETVKLAVIQDELVPGVDDCTHPNNKTSEYGCSTDVRLSCHIVSYLRSKSYEVVEYKTLKEGVNAVKYNKTRALLHFPRNYSESLLERVTKGFRASNKSLELSYIDGYMDTTDFHITLSIMKNTFDSFNVVVQQLLIRCGINPTIIKFPPFKVHPSIFEGVDIRYQPLSGYTVSILCYLAYVYTTSSIVYEKSTGVGERAAVAGITTLEMAVAHLVVQSVLGIGQIFTILLIIHGVFNMHNNGNYFATGFLLLLSEYTGMTFGFLVTEFTTNETLTMYIGVALVVSVFTTIGMIWPVEGMYWIIKRMNSCNPLLKATETYVSLNFRELPLTHPKVYEGYLYLIITSLIFCTLWKLKIKYTI